MTARGPAAATSHSETGFTIDTDAGLVALQFENLSPEINAALRAEEAVLERKVLARVKALAATLDHVRTGAYVASIKGDIQETPDSVMAHIFSGAPQAAILEYGGDLPPHDIVADNARALHFAAFLKGDVFAARVHFPGATIKARPALHQALSEMSQEILAGLIDAGAGKIDDFFSRM